MTDLDRLIEPQIRSTELFIANLPKPRREPVVRGRVLSASQKKNKAKARAKRKSTKR